MCFSNLVSSGLKARGGLECCGHGLDHVSRAAGPVSFKKNANTSAISNP
jgi:hypothetical protein